MFLASAKVRFAAHSITHIHRVVTDNGACYIGAQSVELGVDNSLYAHQLQKNFNNDDTGKDDIDSRRHVVHEHACPAAFGEARMENAGHNANGAIEQKFSGHVNCSEESQLHRHIRGIACEAG